MAARNSLSLKFSLLVAAIFGAALLALLFIQSTQRRSLADLLEAETRERSRMMTRVVELAAQSLRDFAYDYSLWDDMVEFVANPRPEWAAINIDASLSNFNLAAVWVLRPDGTVVYATHGKDKWDAPPGLRFDEPGVRALLAGGKPGSFYIQPRQGLFEICLAPVQPSADTERKLPPRGWVVAARAWNEEHLRLIGDVMQGEVALAPPTQALPPQGRHSISLQYPLRGPASDVVANLVYTLRSEELEIVSRDQRKELGLFALTFALAAVIGGVFVYRWILRPLHVVGESLLTNESGPILPLMERSDEIGRVAQAVKTSFEQQEALEHLVEGRTRLGRELHDGVIQTVYAAGMNLAGARAALRKNPAEAERILDDTRAELNTTIRSLRDFIQGLEPEPLQNRTLREAVQSIVTLMQGVRPIASTLRVDDELAKRFTGSQRLHLLQITREALSNSVRHGQARHVLLRLEREGAGAILEITDDGVGIERAKTFDGGHGLTNLSARARELGGELQMESAPNGGLRIRLAIPIGAAVRRGSEVA
jgi:signal transduction histidine kinase